MTVSNKSKQLRKYRRGKFLSFLFGGFLLLGAMIGLTTGITQVKAENLLILAFHGVTDKPTRPWEITYPDLLDIIRGLKRNDFSPLSPWDMEQWLAGTITGGRRFLVTFDDGLETSKAAIQKLANEEKIFSALFVVTGLLGKPGYVTADDLKILHTESKCRIELHGVSHISPVEILKNEQDLSAELSKGREILEALLVRPVHWYAYPFGEYSEDCRKAVANAGLRLGFTIDARSVSRQDPLLLLPRLMYLKGAKQAGEPVPEDWMPPWNVQMGTLTVTLSVLVFLFALRMFQRGIIYHHAGRL